MTRLSIRGTRRSLLLSACWLLLLALHPAVQAQENAEQLKPRQESLAVKDDNRLRISITYWPSGLKQDASVVVLLHGLGGNQLDWGTLPAHLHGQNYAVITVDLRGHGQSKGKGEEVETKSTKGKKPAKGTKTTLDAANLRARDFEAMVAFDMEAVKQFIFSEHQKKNLNMNKMAIIGAGMGASVALKYAQFDWLKKPHSDGPVGNQTPRGQDIRALVLLSPEEIPGLPLPDAIKTLRLPAFQVAMMFGVGTKDKLDKGVTKKLFDQASSLDKGPGEKEAEEVRMYFQEYSTASRGTGLLGKGQVELNITNFLTKHLQNLQSEWRDRESRVGKKKVPT